MWERLGYKEVDSSVLSRAIKGERLLSLSQIDTFSQILDLSSEEENILKKSYLRDVLGKYGLEDNSGVFLNDELLDLMPEEGKISKKFEKLRGGYWECLVGQTNSEESALEFWKECRERFWAGEYDLLLCDFLSLEKYIYKNKLQKTKAGRYLISASTAVRGDIFTHKVKSFDLVCSIKAKNEIEKVKNLLEESSELYRLTSYSWGSVMRLCGEIASKTPSKRQESLGLLIESLMIRKNAIGGLKEDSEKVSLYSELASTASSIEALFPNEAGFWLNNKTSSSYFFSEALKSSTESRNGNISKKACIFEFMAKWELVKAMNKNLSMRQKSLKYNEILGNLNKAEEILEKTNLSGTVKVNVAVTKHLCHKYFEGSESRDLKMDALRLVLKTSNTRKANLLLQGNIY